VIFEKWVVRDKNRETMIKDLINKRNQICDKADKKEAQIERAQKLLRRYKEKTSWVDTLLKPIAKAIIEKEGFISKHQVMGPFGLSCETSLWFWKTEEDYLSYKNNDEDWTKRLISVTFTPEGYYNENGKHRIGLAVLNRNENSGEYAEGTIGQINGFNHKRIDIDDWDLDTLIAFMYEMNKEKGQ
jgi:hypothetical protein